MFKTITLYENCFDTGDSYPNRVGVCSGSPTPLIVMNLKAFIIEMK